MTVTTERSRAAENGRGAPRGLAAPSPRRAGRRSGRRVVGGVLLVLLTVVTFWQVDLRRHAHESFLGTARAVPAGRVITDADVAVVRVANPSGLALLAANRRAEVVGRTAAVPLAAGSLLTEGQVGPAAWPPSGQAVIAVPVKPGRAPSGLTAGSRVVVLVVPANGAGQENGKNAGARRAVASVVSVSAGTDQVGNQFVTLLLSAEAAETVASASGDVSLVQLGPGE